MHICYIDDSGEDNIRGFSLLSVPVNDWHSCFRHIKQFRRLLGKRDGIYVSGISHGWFIEKESPLHGGSREDLHRSQDRFSPRLGE